MRITRFGEAQPYEAPNHFDVRSLRLQGFTPGGPGKFWIGRSHYLPGGGAGSGGRRTAPARTVPRRLRVRSPAIAAGIRGGG